MNTGNIFPMQCSVLSHLDDKVLSFFNTISESWLKPDVVLKLPNRDLHYPNRMIRPANNVQLKALMQLLSNHVSGLDEDEATSYKNTVISCFYNLKLFTFSWVIGLGPNTQNFCFNVSRPGFIGGYLS